MSVKIEKLIAKHIDSNSRVLLMTQKSVATFDAESDPLNDLSLSRDISFLIQAGLCTPDNAPKDHDGARKLLTENIKPALRMKRACGFYLGEVFMVANRFGVITFHGQSDMPIKGLASMKSPRMSRDIREALGAVASGFSGMDPLFDYSVGEAVEEVAA